MSRWSAWAIECPKCKARRNQACRTLTTGRLTNTHMARWVAFDAARIANR